MRYIEKVAINWADEEINTHEKAEERLSLLSENQKAWRTVEQAIGISHRTPSKREETFAPVWVNEWKFSPEMIREAYDRTIDGTGKYQPSLYEQHSGTLARSGHFDTEAGGRRPDGTRARHSKAANHTAQKRKSRRLYL